MKTMNDNDITFDSLYLTGITLALLFIFGVLCNRSGSFKGDVLGVFIFIKNIIVGVAFSATVLSIAMIIFWGWHSFIVAFLK